MTELRVDANTYVYGSGRGRLTEVVFTTYTTNLYTTLTHTVVGAAAPTTLGETSSGGSSLTTGTAAITQSSGLSSPTPSLSTTPSAFPNASTTIFNNTTAIPLATGALNSTLLSASATNASLVLSVSTSSTLATVISITSLNSSISTPVASAAICGPTAIPPAPTGEGTVEGCTLWYVAQTGDYCSTVAEQFGISADTFMSWNPAVLPPTCSRMLAGDAYCVQACGPSLGASLSASSTSSIATLSTSSSTVLQTLNTASTTPTAPGTAASTSDPLDIYRAYNGDGTAADGWPTEDEWVSFDHMFTANEPNMRIACQAWGVPDNSDAEIATMREQIQSTGEATAVDPRFILAIIMQESTGCVRVITTAYSHANPGLMQSFNGTGSCNANAAPLGLRGVADDGAVQTPCPDSEIRQQILDGTNGTVWGPGLVQDLAEQGNTDSSRWYRAARLYNGGSIVEGDLSQPCCTASYASDVANRMMGWVKAPRVFP